MNSELSTSICRHLIDKLLYGASLYEIEVPEFDYDFYGGKWIISKDIYCNVLFCCMGSNIGEDEITILIWNYNDKKSKAEFPIHFIYYNHSIMEGLIFLSSSKEIKIMPSTTQQQAFILAGIEKLTDSFPIIWSELTNEEIEHQKKTLNDFFIQSQKFDVEK